MGWETEVPVPEWAGSGEVVDDVMLWFLRFYIFFTPYPVHDIIDHLPTSRPFRYRYLSFPPHSRPGTGRQSISAIELDLKCTYNGCPRAIFALLISPNAFGCYWLLKCKKSWIKNAKSDQPAPSRLKLFFVEHFEILEIWKFQYFWEKKWTVELMKFSGGGTWWTDELMKWWTDELMNFSGGYMMNWWTVELMNSRGGTLMNWWTMNFRVQFLERVLRDCLYVPARMCSKMSFCSQIDSGVKKCVLKNCRWRPFWSKTER